MILVAKIDWRARLGNKAFWLALVPAVIVLVQFALEAVGIDFDATALEGRALDLVNAVFTLLASLGIVIDPTTKGFCDGAQKEGGGGEVM